MLSANAIGEFSCWLCESLAAIDNGYNEKNRDFNESRMVQCKGLLAAEILANGLFIVIMKATFEYD